jgi:hypothetical protein
MLLVSVLRYHTVPSKNEEGGQTFYSSRVQYKAQMALTMLTISTMTTCAGSVFILHSAYSCLHFRSLMQGATLGPPPDVVIEVLLGFALCLIGASLYVGPLLPTRSSNSSSKDFELVAPPYRSRDFVLFDAWLDLGKHAEKKLL